MDFWEKVGAAFQVSPWLLALARQAEKEVQPLWREVAERVKENQFRVLQAFRAQGVADYQFGESTGYGYGDPGRETLEGVYARVFRGEAALVRPQIASGTHAITCCLFGLLRPGEEIVFATGEPYETLQGVVGLDAPRPGSLAEWGVSARVVPLRPDGKVDHPAVVQALGPRTRVVAIQRSRGYSLRPALTVAEIAALVETVRAVKPEAVIFCDNCYGEFVETREPLEVGVDLLAGSLIKNPGGGLAPAGGYIVGKKEYVELAATRLTAPGLGMAVGGSLGLSRLFLQGLFLAPALVGEALAGGIFAARLGELAGLPVSPGAAEPRGDSVQVLYLGSAQRLVAFCRGLQAASPVNAHVTPEPGPLPGYEEPVIMAAGTFVQGASLELSADAPLRPPYAVYFQGGLVRAQAQIAVVVALAQALEENGGA